ncbi:hypothetical protein DQ04_00631000 [Trypanosoma grayi]|uniref:hypothetical protein n=1 Tax=Trypanosoma grayi TaxID=71804 RepID=UPI0004F46DE8|nr:hypothetical protein DQ04_00631000 [Trypanosoma grayi]KEG14076.1 hypothetical protein DQ04_00631000 [Trypanosoma grayi]
MHDPFVNRVDYFFPFVPYTEEEKRHFVQLQLRRILLDQRGKERRIYVTPRMVDALAGRQRTFHAATIEGVVRPLLVEVMQKKWSGAVLTVAERVSGEVFVALPTDSGVDRAASWHSLPGAELALAACIRAEKSASVNSTRTTTTSVGSASSSTTALEAIEGKELKPTSSPATHRTAATAPVRSSQVRNDVVPAARVESKRELVLQLEKSVEKELRLELERAKELLLVKDKEIAYLKEKVLQLEKIVALLLATTLMCLFLLSLLVGVKLVFVMCVSVVLGLVLLVGMPLELLMGAIRVLYGVLGPVGSAVAAIVASLWVSQAVRNAAMC